MTCSQFIARYMAEIEQKSGKTPCFYKNHDISETLKFKYIELGMFVWTRGTL